MTASAAIHGGHHGGHHGGIMTMALGNSSWGYGTWLCMGNGNWICPSYSRMQYTVQASKPVESAQAPDPSPNLAGATLFPKTASKDPKTKSAT